MRRKFNCQICALWVFNSENILLMKVTCGIINTLNVFYRRRKSQLIPKASGGILLMDFQGMSRRIKADFKAVTAAPQLLHM